MRAVRILALLVCLSVAMAWAQDQPQAGQKPQPETRAEARFNAEQQAVVQASDRLRQAIISNDPDQLRQILAVNYTGVDMMGRRLDRFGLVEFVAFSPLKIEQMDVETQAVQVSGNGAVQSGSVYVRGSHGGELFNNTYRFIRHWQRNNNEWKLVATHIQGLGGVL